MVHLIHQDSNFGPDALRNTQPVIIIITITLKFSTVVNGVRVSLYRWATTRVARTLNRKWRHRSQWWCRRRRRRRRAGSRRRRRRPQPPPWCWPAAAALRRGRTRAGWRWRCAASLPGSAAVGPTPTVGMLTRRRTSTFRTAASSAASTPSR